MDLLWIGIKYGLLLSLLVGPILFTIVQASIEEGFRAGWMVALGIWMSDIFYIIASYFGVSYVRELLNWDGFEFWLCNIGGMVLIGFGVGSLVMKPASIASFEPKAIRHNSYFILWLRGFLINTANPFTFFFWIGVSSVLFTEKNLTLDQARWFYTGLVGTLALTDTLKIALAKYIRRFLKPKYLIWPRRVAGIVLIIFGIVLLIRSTYYV